jgi:hypothetical protein
MAAKNNVKEKRKGGKVYQRDDIPLTRNFLGPLVDGDCLEKDTCDVWKNTGNCDLSCFAQSSE